MKADTTFELFETDDDDDVTAVVEGDDDDVDMEAAFFSTDDNGGLFCDEGEEFDDELVATLREFDGDEKEPLFSFSFDVVSLFEFDDEMILFCRFLVILAYCERRNELFLVT